MVVAGCQQNKSCSKVLNFLERLDDRVKCTHVWVSTMDGPSFNPTTVSLPGLDFHAFTDLIINTE